MAFLTWHLYLEYSYPNDDFGCSFIEDLHLSLLKDSLEFLDVEIRGAFNESSVG